MVRTPKYGKSIGVGVFADRELRSRLQVSRLRDRFVGHIAKERADDAVSVCIDVFNLPARCFVVAHGVRTFVIQRKEMTMNDKHDTWRHALVLACAASALS